MTQLSDDSMKHLKNVIDSPAFEDSRYRIIQKVESGGMGAIWMADDTRLSRKVALKIVAPYASHESMSERLKQEALVLAQLEHPGIVPVHDVGKLTDGSVYFAMKFVDGITLEKYAQLTRNRHSLFSVFAKVCEAVAFAHSKGVIHRDLKPSNIMIGQFGEALVMDWGIARYREVQASVDTSPTRTLSTTGERSQRHASDGLVLGTPGFMSPEQANGNCGDLTPAADIYALGAILYYLLTLKSPQGNQSTKESNGSQMGANNYSLGPENNLDRRLMAIISKAMATNPLHRYTDSIALANDLAQYSQDEPVLAYPETFIDKARRWIWRNRVIVVMVVVYMVVRLLVYISIKI